MLQYVGVPKILSDTIFTQYGGHTGTSTAAQRTAAYGIAEGQAQQELGTLLTPTIVTGTYMWPLTTTRLQLPVDRLRRVIGVTAIHDTGCNCAADSTEISGCAWMVNADAGIIDLSECNGEYVVNKGCCCTCNEYGMPFQVRVIFEAGLNLEASSDPRLLLGLVTWADLALEQIIDPSGAEGGPGDPGVQSYGADGYSESRTPLVETAAGYSARANYAARMLRPFKMKGALKFL